MWSPIVCNIWSTYLTTNGKNIENNHYSTCQLHELTTRIRKQTSLFQFRRKYVISLQYFLSFLYCTEVKRSGHLVNKII